MKHLCFLDAVPQRQPFVDPSIAMAVGVSVAVTLTVCIIMMVVILMYLKHRWLHTKVEESACARDRVAAYSPNQNNYKRNSNTSMGTEMFDWTAEKTTPSHPSNHVLSFLPVNNIDKPRDDAPSGANTSIPNLTVSVAHQAWTPTGSLYDVQLLTTHLKETSDKSDEEKPL